MMVAGTKRPSLYSPVMPAFVPKMPTPAEWDPGRALLRWQGPGQGRAGARDAQPRMQGHVPEPGLRSPPASMLRHDIVHRRGLGRACATNGLAVGTLSRRLRPPNDLSNEPIAPRVDPTANDIFDYKAVLLATRFVMPMLHAALPSPRGHLVHAWSP